MDKPISHWERKHTRYVAPSYLPSGVKRLSVQPVTGSDGSTSYSSQVVTDDLITSNRLYKYNDFSAATLMVSGALGAMSYMTLQPVGVDETLRSVDALMDAVDAADASIVDAASASPSVSPSND